MPMNDQFREKRFSALKAIARKHGGAILDRNYSILRKPVKARCANGHPFAMTAKNILRGLWCTKCRPLARQGEFLAAAKSLARKNGGKCLSEAYQTARLPLKWQCAKKHRWEASFDNVANKKSWCPTCAMEGASDRKREWWRKRSRKKA